MKRVLLTLLTIVVVLGLFAAAGYAGYRLGYMRGAQVTTNAGAPGNTPIPHLRPFDNFDRRGMPFHNFGRGRQRGFRFGGFPMMGMGFGLFGLFGFLIRLAVFGLIVWLIYWLFTRSGWRLTRTVTTTLPPPPPAPASTETEVTEVKEE